MIVFQTFHKIVQNQFQTKVKILRINNGTKYFSKSFGKYLDVDGIIHQSSYVKHLNKMEWLKENINISLRLLGP